MKGIDYVTETNTLPCIFIFEHTHPKNWFLPWAGLEPTSPWLLVGHAKPLHHGVFTSPSFMVLNSFLSVLKTNAFVFVK